MQLWLPEEVVAVIADSVDPGEDGLVVDPLALNLKERPLGEVVQRLRWLRRPRGRQGHQRRRPQAAPPPNDHLKQSQKETS